MKFPGYWVTNTAGTVSIVRTTFDETELDPANNWKQAWQNQDVDGTAKGYVDFDAALATAASWLAQAETCTLGQAEMKQASLFRPDWQGDRCDIHSLSQLLNLKT